MNPPAAAPGPSPHTGAVAPGGWSSAKVVWFAVVCTVVQAVVVLRLARVPRTVPGGIADPPQSLWAWDAAGAGMALAGGFARHPDPFGDDPKDPFQAVARSAVPRTSYRFAEWTAPPQWLTNPLAMPVVPAVPGAVRGRDSLEGRPPVPRLPAAPLTAGRTTVAAETGLAARAWEKPPEIGPWEGVESPGDTRVELMVNPQGWVVLARVVESSGVRGADELARRALLEARLRPLPGAPRRPGFAASELSAGQVVVRWSSQVPLR